MFKCPHCPYRAKQKTHLKCHLGLRHGHLLSSTTGRICYTTGRRNALIASAQERPARKMELPINAKEMMNPKLVDLRKNNSFLVFLLLKMSQVLQEEMGPQPASKIRMRCGKAGFFVPSLSSQDERS
ncbi:unnamed protein product, partial [Nesidiocoris tenuis]